MSAEGTAGVAKEEGGFLDGSWLWAGTPPVPPPPRGLLPPSPGHSACLCVAYLASQGVTFQQVPLPEDLSEPPLGYIQ